MKIDLSPIIYNNFRISTRYLMKNKFFSAINIAGLAIGMAASMVMFLWIRMELNVDQFHEHKDRIYQAYTNSEKDGQIFTTSQSPHIMGTVLEADYTAFEKVVRTNWVGAFVLHAGDKHLEAGGLLTDPGFLEVFSFPALRGDPKTALSSSRSIVLTETLAKKLFGDENPLNKIVRVDSTALFTVSAVLRDLPHNTRFFFDYLLPWSYTKEVGWQETSWDKFTINTYILLNPGIEAADVNAQLREIVSDHDPSAGDQKPETFLYPMAKWHLWSHFENGKPTGGMIDYVRTHGLIAGIILLIACINYMNLSTARSVRRGKEIGICKIAGANKRSMVIRFLAESVLLAAIASVIAILMAHMALPWFNSINYSNISIPYDDPAFWIFTVGFVLFTGLVAGSYPAFYLSSYKPINAIRNVFQFSHSAIAPRKMLVILQFGFAIFLIACTMVIYDQVQFARARDIGFPQDKLVFAYLKGKIPSHYQALKNDLLSSGVVTSVTRSNSPVIMVWTWDNTYQWEGKDPNVNIDFAKYHVDDDFTGTIGLEVIAGRDIDVSKYPGDSTAILLNETAVKQMGFKDPIGQQLQSQEGNWHVVGVVQDFLPGNAFGKADPMVIQGPGPKHWFGTITFRLSENNSVSNSLNTIEKIFRKYDPEYPFLYEFTDEMFEQQFSGLERFGKLAALTSGLTIFISCLGLFALAAYVIDGRFREIGIRKVLGASIFSIATLLSGDFLKLVLIAILLGSPLAWWSMNSWLSNFPYRVDLSPTLFIFTGVAALAISMLTICFQSIRAALANPAKSLRSE